MWHWKLSAYSNAISCEDGELLLHNSFMGALARIPPERATCVESCLEEEFDDSRLAEPVIKELCDAGFFVLSDVDERSIVGQVLDKERNSVFHLIILPHENCNFRCVYCYEAFERGRMHPDVVAGLKALMGLKTREFRSVSVSWFGGEPLLARKIIYELSDSFRADCERHSVAYSSSITTNGYLLDEKTVDNLLARQITNLQVTLDGPEATHDQARKLIGGGPTYKKILTNLKGMCRRPEDFRTRIRVNFSKQHTASVIEGFLREMQSAFGGDSRFYLGFHAVGKWGGSKDAELEVHDAESAAVAKRTFMEQAMELNFPCMDYGGLEPNSSVCYASKDSSIVVGSDGTIYKCTVAFTDPRNQVGRITRSGELEIDQSRWDLWTKLDGKNVSKCSTCSFNPSCQSRSCPLVAIEKGEPECPISRSGYETLVTVAALGATGRITSGVTPGRLQRPAAEFAPSEVRNSRFGRWDYRA